MRTRLKLDLRLILLLSLLPFPSLAMQENLPDPDAAIHNTVEIEYPVEYVLPYRDRRPEWSPLLSFRYENFAPKAYVSRNPDQASYSGMFGSKAAQMTGLQGGIKRNFEVGSLAGEISWSTGQVSDRSYPGGTGIDINLEMTKTAGHLGFWLDTVWPDPWVVPFAQVDYVNLNFAETDSLGNRYTGTSSGLFGYTIGGLILLNWLDTDASYHSLETSGINNTYLEVFMAKVNGAGSGSSPNFSSDLDWGMGLKMEF